MGANEGCAVGQHIEIGLIRLLSIHFQDRVVGPSWVDVNMKVWHFLVCPRAIALPEADTIRLERVPHGARHPCDGLHQAPSESVR